MHTSVSRGASSAGTGWQFARASPTAPSIRSGAHRSGSDTPGTQSTNSSSGMRRLLRNPSTRRRSALSWAGERDSKVTLATSLRVSPHRRRSMHCPRARSILISGRSGAAMITRWSICRVGRSVSTPARPRSPSSRQWSFPARGARIRSAGTMSAWGAVDPDALVNPSPHWYLFLVAARLLAPVSTSGSARPA